MHARTDSDQRHRAPNTTTWRNGAEQPTGTADHSTELGRWENDGGRPAVMNGGEERHSTSRRVGRVGTHPPGPDHRQSRDHHLVGD